MVTAECTFTWYWLADLCEDHSITFKLGHALYMKAIHGGKAKNDKIDSHKIATILRGGMLPRAYVYPRKMRSTRNLLRRHTHSVQENGELRAHVNNTISQHNLLSSQMIWIPKNPSTITVEILKFYLFSALLSNASNNQSQ